MPGVTLPAQQDRSLTDLWRRVERLERETKAQAAALVRLHSFVFSYAGALDVNTESGRWYPEVSLSITQTRVALLGTAIGNCTVSIRKNGTDLYSVTVVAGQSSQIDYTGTPLVIGDYMTIKVTATGNASDLTVCLVPAFITT